MPKADLKQLDEVADKFRMTLAEERRFGKFLEDCKEHGDRGTKNTRGDFTNKELQIKAREFLDLFGGRRTRRIPSLARRA